MRRSKREAHQPPEATPAAKITLGLEACIDPSREWASLLQGARFGLLMNQASVNASFRYAHDLLAGRFPGQLAALFGPQHGLWSTQQDNMIETPHGREPVLDVPVYSLYADRRRPAPTMLEGLDVLVVDLQDVGTRVYTYIWTLALCLQACAEAGVSVLVLDRPNPLGGEVVEGPLLEPGFESFVGGFPIPMRHGLTIGEMARYLNAAMAIGARLDVVPMIGWQRSMYWSDLDRPWVPTSPNLPRFEGVMCYPGQVLIEGTNLSEGRGTTTPFEVMGAPFIDPVRLCDAMLEYGTPGAVLRPIRFEPTFQKFAGQSCGGVFLHVVHREVFRPYRLTLGLLGAVGALWPEESSWLPPPYEYEYEHMPIDILTGSSRVRDAIDEGLDPAGLDELCAVDTAAWEAATADHRLY